MKKIQLLAIAALITLSVVSCKKSGSTDNVNPNDTGSTGGTNGTGGNGGNGNAPTYSINFKANGVAVSETVVTGTRGSTTNPRSLVISGTGASAANPTFKFYSEESFIGFVQGLNVNCTTASNPSDYIEYTDSNGVLYSTKNNTTGVALSFSDISYTSGGVATGTFSGSISTANKVTIPITDGVFNVKFSN